VTEEVLTAEEVAARAGVDAGFLERAVGLGIVEPSAEGGFTPGDLRRIRLVSLCAEAGLGLEAIGAALDRRTLSLDVLDMPYYERWGERGDLTYAELAARTGIPFEVLRSIQEALGALPPEPDDPIRSDDPALIEAFTVAYHGGFDVEALLRLVRVYGESYRRITRTETQLWHEYVDTPAQQAGASQRDVMTAGIAFGSAVMPLMDAGMLALYRRFQEKAWMEDLVEHVELGLVEAGVYERPERPPAMAFLDLTGYTALTEEHGDHAAAELAASMASVVQRVAIQHGGEALKWLGDGVMFHFPDPGRGVLAALEVVEATPGFGLPPAHVGMHAGPVVLRDGDAFGRTVNLASRVSSQAGPGEVLVTQEVVDAADEASTRLWFPSVGERNLKGVAQPVELFRVERA
jgi:adenylate cyclase